MDDVAMWNRTSDEKAIKSVMNSGLQLLLSVSPASKEQIDKLATTWVELKKEFKVNTDLKIIIQL